MWTIALGFLRGWWKEIAFAIVIAGAAWYAYSWAYDRGAASRQHEIDSLAAEHNRQVAESESAARAREHTMQARITEQAKELDNEYRANAETALALAALQRPPVEPQRLRDQLATARLAAAQVAADSAAACHDRAGTYEALLARGARELQESESLAGRASKSHDDRAAEVEVLVRAWPR